MNLFRAASQCLILGSLALGLLNCGRSHESRLPQDEHIQVYFNHHQAPGARYSEPYRSINRSGDNLEAILLDGINSAQQTIDIAVQELNLPEISNALARRAGAGVRVRLILENTYRHPWSPPDSPALLALSEPEQRKYQEFVALADQNQDGFLNQQEWSTHDAIAILEGADIAILDDSADGSQGSGLMHHKFMVIDRKTVITGSANWTMSGIHGDFANPETRGNVNHLLRIEDLAIAQAFSAEFDQMWQHRRFGVQKQQGDPRSFQVGESAVTLQFSPFSSFQPWDKTSNGLIGATLENAEKSIALALFVFSAQRVANILEQEAEAGTSIQMLIDPSFAFRDYSDGLDLMGVNLKTECDPFNRPWANPIDTVGTPNLAKGDKLHHKFAVIDQALVITGSHNWSKAANYQNDETLIIIENPAIAQHFQQEFERLYEDAFLGIPPFVEDRQQPLASNCIPAALDGIVNLNTASLVELETLPGIGRSLAQRIIENRPYSGLQDLQRVSGIGDQKILALTGKVAW